MTPVVFGTCCICGKPCLKGQRLTAAAPDCLIRHTECVPAEEKGISERR